VPDKLHRYTFQFGQYLKTQMTIYSTYKYTYTHMHTHNTCVCYMYITLTICGRPKHAA